MRNDSRNKRLARLRITELPTLLLTTTPSRERFPAGSASQLAMRQPLTARWPDCFRRAKSRPCFRREPRDKPRRLGAGDGILDRGQAFAALAAAVGQGGATALAAVAGQKAVLALATNLRRLI